jgi:hypothetical protein
MICQKYKKAVTHISLYRRICSFAGYSSYQVRNILHSREIGIPEIGLATDFRSEKIPRNILGIVSVIPWNKVVIPRHSEVYRRVNSEARNGTE